MTVDRIERIKAALEYQTQHGSVHPNDATFMLSMVDAKIIGMDGFKFCFFEDAQDARRRTLAVIEKNGLYESLEAEE